jgi:hypothetical protein
MNLFRSEEHARNWVGFREEAAGGLLPLETLMAMHEGPRHREILNGHYISSFQDFTRDYIKRVNAVTDDNPFWRR